ncbi:MAG TPA: MFS transporter [Candidatus Polarisedimenticolia bacterium]|jgi:DHA1 family multidrug resistance protein-like MFS transporter|nr:MFS transporter [Candidatus Polarisedimenticolia bacterium]
MSWGGLPRETWRRNQLAVNIAAAMIFLGFTLVTPFLPFYIESIGVKGEARIALWSGFLLTVSPFLAAILGPFWGRLADHLGMKVMVQRVLFTIAVHWGLMFFTRTVWQVLALRIMLGLFSGFGTMSVALVTHGCPRERIGYTVGTLQATQIMSTAIGPFVGGLLAATIGIRNTYLVTCTLCTLAFLFVLLLYRDIPAADQGDTTVILAPAGPVAAGWRAILPKRLRGPRVAKPSFGAILRLPLLLPLLPLLFLVNMVDRALFLVVPLCIAAPGMTAHSIEATTGVVMSGGAFAGAASAYVFGRVAGRRAHATRLLFLSLVAGAILIVVMALMHEVVAFALSRVLLGLAVGGAPTLAYAIAGDHIPDAVRASSYALLSSTAMLGASFGPTMTGVLSAMNLRAPLWAGGVTYLLLAAQTVALDRRRRRHAASLAEARA